MKHLIITIFIVFFGTISLVKGDDVAAVQHVNNDDDNKHDVLGALDEVEGIPSNSALLQEDELDEEDDPSISNKPLDMAVTLKVNYEDTNIISEVVQKGKNILVPLEDLKDFNIKKEYLETAIVTESNQKYVELEKLVNTNYTVNTNELSLEINFPPDGMNNQVLNASKEVDDDGIQKIINKTSSGMFINYDLGYTESGENKSLSGLQEVNYFNETGSLKYSFLGSYAIKSPQPSNQLVRMDTNWTVDRPEKNATWLIGDGITKSASWSGGTRFGGVQYSTNFNADTNLIKHPLLAFSGRADLPSVLDIYSNTVPIYHTDLKPGDFQVSNLPIITGSGDLIVKTKDITGKIVTFTIPYYVAPVLLKAGLVEYSYEVGMQRLNYGVVSNKYQGIIANADYMYGVTDYLTSGFHFETLNGKSSIGNSTNYQVGNYGIVSGSVGTNINKFAKAYTGSVGYSFDGKKFDFNTSITKNSKQYKDIYSPESTLPSDPVYRASAGYSLQEWGSFFLTI